MYKRQVGSLYKSGVSNGNTLTLGAVTVENGRLLTDETGSAGENPVCYYGGIVGNVKDVNIRPASDQSVWDFSNSRIVAVSNRMHKDSAVAGLAGDVYKRQDRGRSRTPTLSAMGTAPFCG